MRLQTPVYIIFGILALALFATFVYFGFLPNLQGERNFLEYWAKEKPRCVNKNCREILWDKDNQEQLYDIWVCKNCMDRAQEQAIDELGYRLTLGKYKMDTKILDRIYEILTGRERKF